MLGLVGAGGIAPRVAASLPVADRELGADLVMQPLGEALGGLHAEAVDEELLGELAVALELLDALGHLGADGDPLQHDHVALARVDLEARREGDILGTAQSGKRSSLRLLEVIRDEALVEEARQAAQAIVADDPTLTRHAALRERVRMLAADDRSEFLEKG